MRSALLCALISCLFLSSAFANHYSGVDLRYEHTGTCNLYKVYLTTYRVCEPTNVTLTTAEPINLRSTALNASIYRSFNLVSRDTLFGAYCTGAISSCQSTSSTNFGTITSVYADTATLMPANDWYITWQGSTRSSNIQNLVNPSAQNIYIEAFLNNSSAINSSPWVVNKPALLVSNNNVNLIPFGTMDWEGDSVAYEFYVPKYNPIMQISYMSPYSLSNPLPGICQIVGNSMKLQPTLTGVFTLAIRIKEYRSGQLVGFSSRDWNVYSTGNATLKNPYPTASTVLNATTCPGQTQSLTLSFSDSVATDSIYVQMLPVSNGITFTTSAAPAPGTGAITVSWTTPAGWNPTTDPHFYIPLFVRNNTCPARGYAFYNVKVLVSQCPIDSVWAGDANKDNTANVFDPLAVAIAYGTNGPARPGASSVWMAQYCAPWTTTFLGGINRKHADCNGDGVVNAADLLPIISNWGMTHPKEGYNGPEPKVTGNPDLYFDLTGITLVPGATVSVPVKLGSSTSMMNNFYGVAAHIRIEGLSFAAAPVISYPATWLGNSSNTLNFNKNVSNDNIAWAYARIDQQNMNGSGAIAMVTFTVPANAALGTEVRFAFQNSKLIDKDGNEITAVNIVKDTAVVQFPLSVATTQATGFNIQVMPNPSANSAILNINIAKGGTVAIRITDIAGRVVWAENRTINAGTTQIFLPSQMLSSGLYIVDAVTANNEQQKLKWIKQ